MVSDREDPGRELGPRTKRSQCPIRLEERLLGGVLRLLGIAQRAIRQVVDGAFVALDENAERLALTGERRGDEGVVGD